MSEQTKIEEIKMKMMTDIGKIKIMDIDWLVKTVEKHARFLNSVTIHTPIVDTAALRKRAEDLLSELGK